MSIRAATPIDRKRIREIYVSLNRPKRSVRVSEYLVAEVDGQIIGCGAVRRFSGGGYLYGLAVRRELQRAGVGTAITKARVALIPQWDGELAVVMAMFWNVRFFKRLGFTGVRRDHLPSEVRCLSDFRNPIYRRSAVLWLRAGP